MCQFFKCRVISGLELELLYRKQNYRSIHFMTKRLLSTMLEIPVEAPFLIDIILNYNVSGGRSAFFARTATPFVHL